MVSVLTVGDPHFKTDNYEECDEMTKKILNLATKLNPNFTVILGDTLHTHEKINVFPLTKAIEFIYNLMQISPVFLIIGNHDRPNNSDFLSSIHPFTALKYWDQNKIRVVDKVSDFEINNHKFLFVPYVPPGRFREALNSFIDIPLESKITEYSAIFAHQEFFGAKMGSINSENGDKWNLDNSLIISGHIHEYGKPQKNIIYVGTAYQTSFGDKSLKTVSQFIWESKSDYLENRIKLDLIKKETISLNCKDIFDYDFNKHDNSLLKLKIFGTKEEIHSISNSEIIKKIEERQIKIVYKTIDIDKSPNSEELEPFIKMGFGDLLRVGIEKNEELLLCYNEIFK